MPGDASRKNGTRGGRPKGPSRRTRAIRERILRDEALSVESTVEAIRRGQNYDIRRLFDDKGNLRPLTTLSDEEAFCVAGFEVVIKNAEAGDGHTDRVAKVKLIDRGRYVELAAKHQGMLTEKVEHTLSDELLQRLDRGRLRNAGLV